MGSAWRATWALGASWPRFAPCKPAGKSYFAAFADGPGHPLAQLTPREVDILQLMAAGTENQGIGRRLHLSVETVKDHVRHIFHKLNAKSRIQAAVQGIRLGLVEWPDPR